MLSINFSELQRLSGEISYLFKATFQRGLEVGTGVAQKSFMHVELGMTGSDFHLHYSVKHFPA